MLTSEVLTMVVSRVDSSRLRHRLQTVSFMSRILGCFSAGEPEGEQVQAPSNDVVPLVLDVLRLADGRGVRGRSMMALLFVVECSSICDIVG